MLPITGLFRGIVGKNKKNRTNRLSKAPEAEERQHGALNMNHYRWWESDENITPTQQTCLVCKLHNSRNIWRQTQSESSSEICTVLQTWQQRPLSVAPLQPHREAIVWFMFSASRWGVSASEKHVNVSSVTVAAEPHKPALRPVQVRFYLMTIEDPESHSG